MTKDNEYLEMPWSIDDTIENLFTLKEVLKIKVVNENFENKGKQDAKEIEFDFNRAINALKKQIPEKIVHHDNCGNETPYQPRCPKCYEAVTDTFYLTDESWCPYCGQRLDWRKDE